MARVRIRLATLRDLETLVAHRRGMWEAIGGRDPDTLGPADAVYRRWARQRLRSGHLVGFVAQADNGSIVASGCLWLRPSQPFPGRPRTTTPYLLSMFTEPGSRNRGLGSRILREAIRWCRSHGYARLTLDAAPMGRGLYRAAGFERTWEMRLRLDTKGRDRRRARPKGRGRARRSRTKAAASRRR